MQYFKKYLKTIFIWVNLALLFYTSAASAELVVIGNPNIKVSQLTQKELSALYLGKPFKLSTKEHLTPFSQPEGSTTYQEFYQKIIGWNSNQASRYWSSQIFSGQVAEPAIVDNEAAAITQIAKTPGAVAYVDSSALANVGNSVKILFGNYQPPKVKRPTIAKLYNNEPVRPASVTGYHSMYEAPVIVPIIAGKVSDPVPAEILSPGQNPSGQAAPARAPLSKNAQAVQAENAFKTADANDVNNTIIKELQQNTAPQGSQNIWNVIASQIHVGPEASRSEVQAQIKWFTSHPHMLHNMIRDATPFIYYVYQETQRRHMPTEFTLLPMIESGYYPYSLSNVGAAGIWQMMPETATDYGLTIDWWYDARRDIITSTNAALNFLVRLHAGEKNWDLAAASYDAGEGKVDGALARNRRAGKPTDFWALPLPKETRDYVPRLLALAEIIKNPARYGVTMPDVPDVPYFVAFTLKSQIDVAEAAKLAEVPQSVIVRLNTGMRRFATNLTGKYTLLIPAMAAQSFQSNLAKIAGKPETSWQYHKVLKGETLEEIANNFHTSLALLESINNLKMKIPNSGSGILVPISINKYYENPLNVLQPSSVNATIPQSAEFAPMPKVDTWAVEKITTGDILTGKNMDTLIKSEPKAAAKPAAPTVQLVQPQALLPPTTAAKNLAPTEISANDDLKTMLTKIYHK